MTQIRPVREDEADAFLRLLCEVFALDYLRAKSIFFREPMFDLARKWALFEEDEMVSILTTVPLQFGWGNAIGIAGVATHESHRGKGLALELLREVLRHAESTGEGHALLFAEKTVVYERAGFRLIDEVIRGTLRAQPKAELPDVLTYEQVAREYGRWAEKDLNRLRRDERRWNYWKWNFRTCARFAGGYLCLEGGVVRECITNSTRPVWPVPDGTEWLGLRSMTEMLSVPVEHPHTELFLMGYNFEQPPQMFMTDQF